MTQTMDRRKFIETSIAAFALSAIRLGASPLESIGATATPKSPKARRRSGIDDNLVVFISDLHLNPDGYQVERLKKVVADIVSMRPLPRNVIALGDLAYLTGQRSEYEGLKPLLAPIEAAGITLTLAMGNHDRRAEFRSVFPEQAARSLMSDRLVYKVETPRADFLVLDSLQEGDDRSTWITAGALNEAQTELVQSQLAQSTKPMFVCSHHPINETGLTNTIAASTTCCGYIYGHLHTWRKTWTEVWKKGSQRVVRMLCMPSTGHWGDIGYVTLRLEEAKAVATMHQSDFYFPEPIDNPPAQWPIITEENDGDTCTFEI